MKRILIIALLSFGMNAMAQINFEFAYDQASGYDNNQLMIVNFEVSGEKFVKVDRIGKAIEIYSLGHELEKTISFAGFPQSINQVPNILYISENLFNTDPKKEFMYIYNSDPLTYCTSIYNEDGNLIFEGEGLAPLIFVNTPLQQYPIYNTSEGTKMILSDYFSGDAFVYSLPGTLSTGIEQANAGLIAQSSLSGPVPNPALYSTRIDYTLPEGIERGEIVFFDLSGKEIKRVQVSNAFPSLWLSTTDIGAGTYYYQLQAGDTVSNGKKMIVIK